MEHDLTPAEARGGVISGRIITALAISVVGAVTGLAVAWATVTLTLLAGPSTSEDHIDQHRQGQGESQPQQRLRQT